MRKIEISVEDEKLETLLGILENLKSGLIADLQLDGKALKTRQAQYQAKTKKVIYEQESGTNDTSGKYMNPAAYKNQLKKKNV